MASAIPPKRSTPTTGGGWRCGRIAGNAAPSAGARRNFTAGRRTRPANMAYRRARTLAPSCAARVFASISRSSRIVPKYIVQRYSVSRAWREGERDGHERQADDGSRQRRGAEDHTGAGEGNDRQG